MVGDSLSYAEGCGGSIEARSQIRLGWRGDEQVHQGLVPACTQVVCRSRAVSSRNVVAVEAGWTTSSRGRGLLCEMGRGPERHSRN